MRPTRDFCMSRNESACSVLTRTTVMYFWIYFTSRLSRPQAGLVLGLDRGKHERSYYSRHTPRPSRPWSNVQQPGKMQPLCCVVETLTRIPRNLKNTECH
jgi:hypothetical protein